MIVIENNSFICGVFCVCIIEFIRGLASPLCSDAYSWFIQDMAAEKEHNKEVSLATNYLLMVTIPAFAHVLIKLVGEAISRGTKLQENFTFIY